MLSAGIVGLPNVGKSTLFNAVTRTRKASAENYPFCTIEPNMGMVVVPDPRLDGLARISGSPKITPAVIEFVDIAGLVKGASEGEGLGNQFLGHIREVDAVVQVVRCFDDPDIHHVGGGVDPLRDIEIVNTELILADIGSLGRRAERLEKPVRAGEKSAKAELEIVVRLRRHLDGGKPAHLLELGPEEQKIAAGFFLLTSKPTIFACNIAEAELGAVAADLGGEGGAEGPGVRHVRAVSRYAREHLRTMAVVISAQIESELGDLPADEAKEYLAGAGVRGSGVDSLIGAVYRVLGLRTFMTANDKEARAWTIGEGAKAPAAAGAIHSDFERGFIAAQVIGYDDLAALGSFAKARDVGKLRLEGKDYVVRDGDVIEFRFNV